MDPVSRRTLLKAGAAAAPLLLSGGIPVSALARRPRGVLPTGREVYRQVREMVDLGPRLTATSPHLNFIDALDERFRRAGLSVTRDPQPFQQWLAQDFAIEVAGRPVPVASYYTYSGKTGPEGVTGDLVYAGPIPSPPSDPEALPAYVEALPTAIQALLAAVPGGVQRRIVLMDAPNAPLTPGSFDPLLTYRYDPHHTTPRRATTSAPGPRSQACRASSRSRPPAQPARSSRSTGRWRTPAASTRRSSGATSTYRR